MRHPTTRRPALRSVALGILAWSSSATALAITPAEEDEPQVELLESRALVGGAPAKSNRQWEAVMLSLHLRNRLPVEVSHLEVEVALVGAGLEGAGEAPIPGWKFLHGFDDTKLPPLDESFLILEHALPAQRRPRSAEEIGYRVSILSYRLQPPSLDLALQLLRSSAIADQHAAFRSYSFSPDAPLPESALAELEAVLTNRTQRPNPTNALRLLFAIRAAGSLGDARFVAPLLSLIPRVSSGEWRLALDALITRLAEASESDEPRLRLLPTTATSSLAEAPGLPAELFRETIRESLTRLGDLAIPGLVEAAHATTEPGRTIFARGLLHALGRPTARAQLSVSDRTTRLLVIEAFGKIGSAEPVSALAELTQSRDRKVREAALSALRHIGPAAVEPLVDALGTPDRESQAAILSVIRDIGPRAVSELRAAAVRYGIELQAETSFAAQVSKLAEQLSQAARQRWTAELERGLRLGAEARYDEAFRILDAVYGASPELYMQAAVPIAELYSKRARSLFLQGNFDAAITALRVGQSISPSAEASELLVQSRLELARGFLDLDAVERAEEMLSAGDLTREREEVRRMRSSLLARRAELAMAKGEYAKARGFVDSAKRLGPGDERLRGLDRRLLLTENLPVVIVLGLLIPAALLASILLLRHRLHIARIRRLESVIDDQV